MNWWSVLALAGLALVVALIHRLFRGAAYRDYPLLFAYLIAALFASLVEAAAFFNIESLRIPADRYPSYYWASDVLLRLLIFGVLVAALFRALEGVPGRARHCFLLTAALFLITVVAAGVTWPGPNERWWRGMTVLSRNLAFYSLLVAAFLWKTLLERRVSDRQLLLLSAGLGIQSAGAAMGHSLRWIATANRSSELVEAGNVLILVTHLLCLAIWLAAYWRPASLHFAGGEPTKPKRKGASGSNAAPFELQPRLGQVSPIVN